MISFFLCKTLFPKWRVAGDSANTRLGFIQTTLSPTKLFSSSSSTSTSTSTSTSVKDELRQSFKVSYLKNSCGLPLESAISASHKVNFETPERPDSVLALLRDHGFTNTHINRLVRTRPTLLLVNPQKTLLPKLEFFHSIGFSSTDLANFVSSNPTTLTLSLEKHLMPWYNFLKSLLLDEKCVVKAIKNSFRIFNRDVQKNFAPNISVMREHGVPQSRVLLTVKYHPTVLDLNRYRFDEVIKEVVEMGYNPKKTEFIHAMVVFKWKKSFREHKMEVFRRWGWSENDVQLMLKKCPLSMSLSEKKLTRAMDFLVNRMGCQIAAIARYPLVFQFSLEKRVIPRYSVIKVLLLKGLIKKDLSLGTFLMLNEKQFQDKFVSKYEEDVPELLNVYQGKMSLLDLGFGWKEICEVKKL